MNILLLLAGAGIGALGAFFFLLLILKTAARQTGCETRELVRQNHIELCALLAERNRLYAENGVQIKRFADAVVKEDGENLANL